MENKNIWETCRKNFGLIFNKSVLSFKGLEKVRD